MDIEDVIQYNTPNNNQSVFKKPITEFQLYIKPYTGKCRHCPTDNTTTVDSEIQKCFGTKPVHNEVPTTKCAPTPTPSGLPPLPPLMKPGSYKTRSLFTPINLGKLQSLATNYKEDRQKSPLLEQWKDLFINLGEGVDEKPTNPGEKSMDEKPSDRGIQCHNPNDNTHKITADYHMMQIETGTGYYKWQQPLSDDIEEKQNKKMKIGNKKK